MMVKANPFEDGIPDAISILANSNNGGFQMSAIVALGEFLGLYWQFLGASLNSSQLCEIGKVDVKVLEPLVQLLKSSNIEVKSLALTALNKFAEDDQNKSIIARSGALVPLLRLTQSEDAEVQQGATAVFRELAQQKDSGQMVIDAGAVPVMLKLLKPSDKEVRLNSAETLNQVEFDLKNFHKSDTTASELVHSIIALSNSDDIREIQQAAMAYVVITHEERFQDEIAQHGGLESLRGLLMLTDLVLVRFPLLCINKISDDAKHQARLVDGGFLDRLIELLECTDEDIQDLAASTLFRLANNSELGRAAVANSNVVERIRVLVPNSPPEIQTFMVMITSTLIDNDIFIHCTTSSSERGRRYAANAIGKVVLFLSDYQPLVKAWGIPAGGIHGFLLRLLEDPDEMSRMRGIGIILSTLDSKNEKMINMVKNAGKLKAALRQIAQLPKNTTPSKPTRKMSNLFGDTAFNVQMSSLFGDRASNAQMAKKALNMMEKGKQ
ncbi:Vacuolar protein 8 [Mortierella sp. AD010]|nr:Vacuolar protein 8 [Mortierella sp. AD010]